MKTTGIQSLRRELDQKAIEIANMAMLNQQASELHLADRHQIQKLQSTVAELETLLVELRAQLNQCCLERGAAQQEIARLEGELHTSIRRQNARLEEAERSLYLQIQEQEQRAEQAERERDALKAVHEEWRTQWQDAVRLRDGAVAERDFWKAECEAAKESRDAACHERDAHAEAANQAEADLRTASRQNCEHCGGTGRIHSHNDICGCVDVPRLLTEERKKTQEAEADNARRLEQVRHLLLTKNTLREDHARLRQERDALLASKWVSSGEAVKDATTEIARLRAALEQVWDDITRPSNGEAVERIDLSVATVHAALTPTPPTAKGEQ